MEIAKFRHFAQFAVSVSKAGESRVVESSRRKYQIVAASVL